MKNILISFIILFAIGLNAQRFDGQVISGTTYLIRKDTTATGVITITYLPSSQMKSDIDSQIESVDSNIQSIQDQIASLQLQIKELIYQRNRLVATKTKLGL